MSTTDEDRQRLLSPEELVVMAEDDYDADEHNAAAMREIGRGDLDDEEEDDEARGDDKKGRTAAPAPAPATAPAQAAAPSPVPAPAAAEADASAPAAAPASAEGGAATVGARPAPAPAPHPTYMAELPADYDAQVAANKAALTDLRTKFDDGAVDAAEYHGKLDELQEQRADLREAKTRAQVASEMREQAEAGAWLSAINTLAADAATKPELGPGGLREGPCEGGRPGHVLEGLGCRAGERREAVSLVPGGRPPPRGCTAWHRHREAGGSSPCHAQA
ncbi:hypothetical protein QRO11_11645 [Paracidovorax citrulli]|uniref:Uncharacterized protein n=2 Tax=Paracidovorax citrulli TaxID=80869 RepID=A1TPU8_PARC0|nr:hypothetical protein [Paracidovorax citrulli]ABM32986.1 hypothetical protein Aave_2411 [Paracidovorax citrulli AAC00-1]UEG44223.1 hypothetical protein LKW27_11025 [Paracidovorax citrulli]WIY31255.1 hypothetical protein QRO09_05920 [Paracidovorax citrulli]WIY32641.1 hypothetical protein QRO11_11645 [Paracidovorax citrulli]WIY40534.1 hypothetical protein QRO10_06200 [Paracidovorax citrulli]